MLKTDFISQRYTIKIGSYIHKQQNLRENSHFYDYEITSDTALRQWNSGSSLSYTKFERTGIDNTASRVAGPATTVDKVSFATTSAANNAGLFISSLATSAATVSPTTTTTTGYVLNTILNNITSSILLSDSSSSNNTTTNFLNNNLSELGLYGLHRNITGGDDAASSTNGIMLGGGGGATTTAANNDVPQIPDYIRYTSMVFCIAIMCLGVIGNIMVNDISISTLNKQKFCNFFTGTNCHT